MGLKSTILFSLMTFLGLFYALSDDSSKAYAAEFNTNSLEVLHTENELANALPSSASSLDKLDAIAPTIVNANLTKLEADDLISTQEDGRNVVVIVKIDFDPYPFFPPNYYYSSGGYTGYLKYVSYSYEPDGKYHVVYEGKVYKSGTPIPFKVEDKK